MEESADKEEVKLEEKNNHEEQTKKKNKIKIFCGAHYRST